MATIHLDNISAEVGEGETVLDALLRAGAEVPHACRAGACQSCLMRCVDGSVSERSGQGLRPALREQGYFLACMEKPGEDLHVSLEAAEQLSVPAMVAAVEPLSHNVVRLLLEPRDAFSYRPGQFLNLVRLEDGLVRSYSIASVPGWDGPWPADEADGEGLLDLHVRRVPNGRMSNWVASELAAGDAVAIRGPAGECYYTEGSPEQPLMLAGSGTGLAPLWGIARDALARGHTGPIVLYHGALDRAGLYLVDELEALAAAHQNVSYYRCVLRDDASAEEEKGLIVGRLDEQITRHGDLSGWRVFLCGDPGLVTAMRKRAFLAGAGMQSIHADAFVMAGG